MTYAQCLDYLYRQLPQYQRIGAAAYKANLDNTLELLRRLRNPERDLQCLHIAGTNGKGSVSHMLASVMMEAGYKTGLYTSPHLKDFRERIRINGEMISEQEVVDFVVGNKELVEDIRPSFFEWTVALAFHYFKKSGTDICVIETGLGGRLDSTNVILPKLSVITNIAMDHMQFLGQSIAQIAAEKAGIIKSGVPVVIGEATVETRKLFRDKGRDLGSQVIFAQDHELPDVESDLKGPYQYKNKQCLLHAIKILQKNGMTIGQDAIRRGLQNVIRNTGLRGRWEWVQEKPSVLLDVAHNGAGIKIVMREVANLNFNKLHIVWGMMAEKDSGTILNLLPGEADYYFCSPALPRALPVEKLKEEAVKAGLKGKIFNSVDLAYKAALKSASVDDLVLVTGSTFVVAEVLP